MRALVWFAGCVGLYFVADYLRLWRPMLDYTAILFIWAWVFVGAFWVSKGAAPRRRAPIIPPTDASALKTAAERAAEKSSHEPWGTPP